MSEPFRVGVLVSGGGTNLQALLDACRGGVVPAEIVVVISNVPTALALQRAAAAGVPTVVVDHRNHASIEAFEAALRDVLLAHHVDLVCLAGFLRILTTGFVGAFAGRIVNIHPALLPAFGGKGMYGARVHRAVLASGARLSGCTVHFVTAVPDGGPVIAQATVPVAADETAETLAARVAEAEHRLYPEVVRLFAERRVRLEGDEVKIAPSVGSGLAAETR